MSGQRIRLRTVSQSINVLPPGSTLTDFVSACQANPAVQKVDFYVMAGAEEMMPDQPKIKNLPFQVKAVGSDQYITLVEQPPLHIGKIAYQITDRDCKQPLGLSRIKPLQDLKEYAWESAIYLAQHGFNVASYFRFRSGPIEEVGRIMANEAKKHAPLAEPVVIYL